MINLEQKAEMSQRSIQAKRLLDAISNYKPTQQELKAMANAKKQMIRNIERKFQNSQPNSIYKFPFNSEVQKDQYQFQVSEQTTEIENLYEQNFLVDKFNEASLQRQRPVLIEKNQNAKEKSFQTDLKSDTKNKQKDASVINNIQKAINSGLKCQTPKVIKKQIILTTKKHPQKQNCQSFISTQNADIRSKLKIKKPNTVLNQTKKHIHLKTQNNINCKPYYQLSSHKKQNQKENQSNKSMKTEHEVILQENYEESLFFNSRTHQNIDENTNFQYPKQSFNVFELKQKLRSASKSAKKDFTKRHKRTATQADSEIKIKIFTSSFKKPNASQKDIQNEKKQLFSTSLFKKPENIESRSHFMNRTKSSLSQHSLKKGIKICGKMDQQYEKSQQKSQIKNKTLTLKGTSSSKKESDSKAKKLFKDDNKKQKQNIQENKVSKINSIMTSLKQGYKVKNATLKNHSKSKCGIKATICL